MKTIAKYEVKQKLLIDVYFRTKVLRKKRGWCIF